MNNLQDIIGLIKEGRTPDYEELRYSVLALNSLLFFESRAIIALSRAQKEKKQPVLSNNPTWQEEESFERRKRVMLMPPNEYIGWDNDPQNPRYIERVEQSKLIVEKLVTLSKI